MAGLRIPWSVSIALLFLIGCSDAPPPRSPSELGDGGLGGASTSGGAGSVAGLSAAPSGGEPPGSNGGGSDNAQAGTAASEAGAAGNAPSAGTGGVAGLASGGTGGCSTAVAVGCPTPEVRAGCESVAHDGHQYALCRDAKVAFPEARKDCEAMNMQLIRLDSAAESDWIYQTFYAKPTSGGSDSSQMWTGGTDNVVEGEWSWLAGGDVFWRGKADGMAVGGLYTNWGRAHGVGIQDQPNDSHSAEGEDCMVIRGPDENEQGHWTDIGCGAENAPPATPARIGWYSCEAG